MELLPGSSIARGISLYVFSSSSCSFCHVDPRRVTGVSVCTSRRAARSSSSGIRHQVFAISFRASVLLGPCHQRHFVFFASLRLASLRAAPGAAVRRGAGIASLAQLPPAAHAVRRACCLYAGAAVRRGAGPARPFVRHRSPRCAVPLPLLRGEAGAFQASASR